MKYLFFSIIFVLIFANSVFAFEEAGIFSLLYQSEVDTKIEKVIIFADTKGEGSNAFDLTIGFDPKKLKLLGVNENKNISTTFLSKPVVTDGTIKISATVFDGFSSSFDPVTQSVMPVEILNIDFVSLESGIKNIVLTEGSIYLEDGYGTKVGSLDASISFNSVENKEVNIRSKLSIYWPFVFVVLILIISVVLKEYKRAK